MVLEYFCPVCQEEYLAADVINITGCGHVFHRKCLHDWLAKQYSCPDCRTPCTPRNTFKVFIKSRDSEFVNEMMKAMEENETKIVELQSELKANDLLFSELRIDLETSIANQKDTLALLTVEEKKLDQQIETIRTDFERLRPISSVAVKTAGSDTKNLKIQPNKGKSNASGQSRNISDGGAVNNNRSARNAERLDKVNFELFKYTKRLHRVGYRHIFYQDNVIYIKKNSFSQTTKVANKMQVDELMRQAMSQTTYLEEFYSD